MVLKLLKTQRTSQLLAKIDAYRADLELEISYPHWTYDERRVLQKALKWFNQLFPTATRR